MAPRRACDACAARKIRCDRESPCRRCKTLSISCTTLRAQSKSGPKGPWAKKKRGTQATQTRQEQDRRSSVDLLPLELPAPVLRSSTPPSFGSSSLPLSLFRRCLDVYQQALYPVWPVVDRDDLFLRLQDQNNIEVYALAAAISAVTIAQLKLPPEGDWGLYGLDSLQIAAESERARHEMDYQENPSINTLLSSFFLHVSSANRGQIRKAAFLLREAITCAQLLGLDKASHYLSLSKREAQLHLRIVWLLFITER
jgi:hypothetical protein